MNRTVSRRNFFELLKGATGTYLVLRVTGCGPIFGGSQTGQASKTLAESSGHQVQVYNLLMQAWSIYGSGQLGDTGYLPSTTVRDFQEVTLDYTQDAHGHRFTLGPEQFSALLRGEMVRVITTEAEGHQHEVRIDPNDRDEEAPLVMYVDDNGYPVSQQQPQPTPSAQPAQPTPSPGSISNPNPALPTQQPAPDGGILHAKLNESAEPNLYVQGTSELQEDSVQFCLDSTDRCNADASLWHPLHRYAGRPDKQIFVSDSQLALDRTTANQLPLMVRAKSKSDGRILNLMLKLNKIVSG